MKTVEPPKRTSVVFSGVQPLLSATLLRIPRMPMLSIASTANRYPMNTIFVLAQIFYPDD
jgi:hypothetical protein